MEELAKIGFTYDVTQFSPEGDEVSHQVTKNLITNQGVRYLLCQIFKLEFKTQDQKGTISSLVPGTGSSYSNFYLGFIETDYVPKKTDSVPLSIQNDYGFSKDIWPASSKDNTFYSGGWNTNRNNTLLSGTTNVIQLSDFIYTETKFRVITGFFLLYARYYGNLNGGGTYSNIINDDKKTYMTSACLLSAAQLPSPVQMVPNGTLKIKTGFTLISS